MYEPLFHVDGRSSPRFDREKGSERAPLVGRPPTHDVSQMHTPKSPHSQTEGAPISPARGALTTPRSS